MEKTAQERLNEKVKRLEDTIALRTPDRVPLFASNHLFPARLVGMTYEDAYYDQDKWLDANRTFLEEYDPDVYFFPNAPIMTGGAVHDILGTLQIKWPGRGVDANTSFQFVEGEYMKQAEYDMFLDDPSDFIFRVYLPRIFTSLNGFGMLPPLKSLVGGYTTASLFGLFAMPPLVETLEKLLEAAKIAAQWSAKYDAFFKEAETNGHLCANVSIALAPFDTISDMLRGMKGTMFDMFQAPDKLLAAQEKLLPLAIGSAIGMAQMSGNNRVFIPLHRGADGFMSNKQFEKFYWPYLKTLIEAITDAGCIAMPFFEGVYEQRLEYLQELPKGKVIAWFDRSDMNLVKEKLGGRMCICGGMPITMLQTSTVDKVKEYTKNLIETVGCDGGYIMTSSTVLDEARPELVKAWMDATKEYGVY